MKAELWRDVTDGELVWAMPGSDQAMGLLNDPDWDLVGTVNLNVERELPGTFDPSGE